jgi:tetratricopeptide (TPR) repeat protein
MESFKVLEEKIDAALKGGDPISDFYKAVFGKVLHLLPQERELLIKKTEALNDHSPFGKGAISLFRGMSAVFDADFLKAVDNLLEADKHFASIKEYGGIMSSNNLLSISFRSTGQLDKAQAHLQISLKAAEHVTTDSLFGYFKTVAYYQAGELNTISKNYETARQYYLKGMEFIGENPELEGRLLNGLGNLLMQTDEWEKALDYFHRALVTAQKAENPLLSSKLYADIGNYYLRKKDFVLALENQNKSLNIRLERGFLNPSISNYIHLAEIHLLMGDAKEAIKFGTMAVEAAGKFNVLIKLYEAHSVLARAYEKAGDFEKAYENFRQFHKLREEVHNQEAIKKIEQMQSNHKMELMQNEKEIFRLKNVELRALLDEIGDSFRYARRIQTSLLPSEKYIERVLERLKGK